MNDSDATSQITNEQTHWDGVLGHDAMWGPRRVSVMVGTSIGFYVRTECRCGRVYTHLLVVTEEPLK
jgi:hypothetical protein